VKRLVGAAPAIAGWKVVAFRQRKAASLQVVLDDGTKLGPEAVTFRASPPADGKVDVYLFVPGAGATVTDKQKQLVLLLLDSLLGEYDTETRVAGLTVAPAASAPPDARPLPELVKVVDALK
jgi:hypothetical protein